MTMAMALVHRDDSLVAVSTALVREKVAGNVPISKRNGEGTATATAFSSWDFANQGPTETASRPPTPPDHDASPSPNVPLRWIPLVPPPNYGTVDVHAIYRSSFPQARNLRFIRSLGIRSVLILVDTPPALDFQTYLAILPTPHAVIRLATNKDGAINTTTESLHRALLHLMTPANHPVLVHCNQGKHRTGCLVACLRKVQGTMPLPEILEEYVAYASPKVREGDLALIRGFDVKEFVQFLLSRGLEIAIEGGVGAQVFVRKLVPWDEKAWKGGCESSRTAVPSERMRTMRRLGRSWLRIEAKPVAEAGLGSSCEDVVMEEG